MFTLNLENVQDRIIILFGVLVGAAFTLLLCFCFCLHQRYKPRKKPRPGFRPSLGYYLPPLVDSVETITQLKCGMLCAFSN